MADTTAPAEDLTSESNFDINDIIAQAIAAEAEEPVDTSLDDAADGPESHEDPGELTAENSDGTEETESDQTEAPVEEPSGDAEPAKPAVETPPAPVAPDPHKAEIERLTGLVAQSQQLIANLVARQTQPAQPTAKTPSVSEEAVRLALFGGAEGSDAWKALSPQDRSAAEQVARDYFKREAKAAVNPAARFNEIEEQVLLKVSEIVGPLVQDFYDRQAAQTFQDVAGSIKDPAEKKRLQELYSLHPGSRGQTLNEQKTALEVAAQRLDIERQKKELEARELKLVAKQRDQVNRKPPSKANGTVRRSDAPKNKLPAWEGGASNMLDFATRLAAMESAGA